MTPYYDKRHRDWRLNVPLHETETQDALQDIPGLGFSYEAGQVRGSIDAVRAACMALKITEPTVQKELLVLKGQLPLMDYQTQGVSALTQLLQTHGGALLADDMGLGKTLQTIATANHLGCQRVLIVCPRFLSFNWSEELTKWGEPDFVLMTPGTTKRHAKMWETATTAKWVITSYEMLPKVAEQAFATMAPDFIAFDEAHMVKNVSAGRSQVAKDVANLAPFKLAITATPMWSRPKDFFGILKVLFGKRFGSRTAFFKRYCGGTINAYGGLQANGATHEAELKARLGDYMVRREKKDVAKDLPSLTRQVIWLPTDVEGEKALKAAVLNKQRNATYEAVRATAVAKMDAACELANTAKQFVLFTYERKHAEQLGAKLELMGTPCVVIHGGLPIEQRQARIGKAKFLKCGIVATIDSLGAGVNLQGVAHIGIMHVLDWVPLKLAQAEARIHRLGQTQNVHWYYLACKETIDEVIVRNIVSKMDQWRAIIGSDSNRGLRDDLGGDIGGGTSEEDALRAIYAAMED